MERHAPSPGSPGSESTFENIPEDLERGMHEYGREFPPHRDENSLPILRPQDSQAEQAARISSAIWQFLANDDLTVTSPLQDVRRILHINCGTGTWCTLASEKYPNAKVRGWDTITSWKRKAPQMVSFYVGDFKEAFESCERWDIILLSDLLGTVQDWKEIYRSCYRNLNSGGILIHRELEPYIHPLDSLPPTISQFNTFLRQAAESAGTPLDIAKHMQEQMKGQNFSVRANIDPKHRIPLGTWDHRRQYVMLGELSLARIHLDLEGLCLRMFKQLGWTAEMTKTFIDKVLEEINGVQSSKHPLYQCWYIVESVK